MVKEQVKVTAAVGVEDVLLYLQEQYLLGNIIKKLPIYVVNNSYISIAKHPMKLGLFKEVKVGDLNLVLSEKNKSSLVKLYNKGVFDTRDFKMKLISKIADMIRDYNSKIIVK